MESSWLRSVQLFSFTTLKAQYKRCLTSGVKQDIAAIQYTQLKRSLQRLKYWETLRMQHLFTLEGPTRADETGIKKI